MTPSRLTIPFWSISYSRFLQTGRLVVHGIAWGAVLATLSGACQPTTITADVIDLADSDSVTPQDGSGGDPWRPGDTHGDETASGDPECGTITEEGPPFDDTCSNGKDDDCDQLVDMEDPQCVCPANAVPFVLQRTGVDPYPVIQDTFINEWYPTTPYGTETAFRVRSNGIMSTLIRFDLSQFPPGVHIDSATLSLYTAGKSNDSSTRAYLFRVLRDWSADDATWKHASSGVPWGAEGCGQAGFDFDSNAIDDQLLDTVPQWAEFEITALVNDWVQHPNTNFGVVIKADGETAIEFVFPSSDQFWAFDETPKLVVSCSAPE